MAKDKYQLILLLAHVSLALIVIVSATILTALDKLDPQATVAVYGAAIGLAGGLTVRKTNGGT